MYFALDYNFKKLQNEQRCCLKQLVCTTYNMWHEAR